MKNAQWLPVHFATHVEKSVKKVWDPSIVVPVSHRTVLGLLIGRVICASLPNPGWVETCRLRRAMRSQPPPAAHGEAQGEETGSASALRATISPIELRATPIRTPMTRKTVSFTPLDHASWWARQVLNLRTLA
jgi:hypothetical protein